MWISHWVGYSLYHKMLRYIGMIVGDKHSSLFLQKDELVKKFIKIISKNSSTPREQKRLWS